MCSWKKRTRYQHLHINTIRELIKITLLPHTPSLSGVYLRWCHKQERCHKSKGNRVCLSTHIHIFLLRFLSWTGKQLNYLMTSCQGMLSSLRHIQDVQMIKKWSCSSSVHCVLYFTAANITIFNKGKATIASKWWKHWAQLWMTAECAVTHAGSTGFYKIILANIILIRR